MLCQYMKHSQVRLWRGPIFQDVAYDISITVAKRELDFGIKKGTRYITLTGEIWDAFYEARGVGGWGGVGVGGGVQQYSKGTWRHDI